MKYLIQDTRSPVGDFVVWWRQGRAGYTSVLDEAGEYDEHAAASIERIRGTDRKIPVDVAKSIATTHVSVHALENAMSERNAYDVARMPDGSIDALTLGATSATDIDFSSEDPAFRFRSSDVRFPGSNVRQTSLGDAGVVEAAAPTERITFLKFPGGKWRQAPKIASLLPYDWRSRVYREPFLGGGSMFFYLRPERATICDVSSDLIAAYSVVAASVEALIERLTSLKAKHSEANFYAVREHFNSDLEAGKIDRAAWLIYLNRTCFNGLFRYNQAGQFNSPFGRYVDPKIVDRVLLRKASEVLRKASIRCESFEHLVDEAAPGDLIYMDPPYLPSKPTSSFVGYSGGFDAEKHRKVAEVFRMLDERGCLLLLSNRDTERTRELYAGYDLVEIPAMRSIAADGGKRKTVNDLLIRNTARWPTEALPK